MTSTSRERALTFLSGQAPAEPVCMQIYVGLFLEDRRREALAEVYRELLGDASERTLSFEELSDAMLEAWARAWATLSSPPAWMPLPGWPTRSADGTRILLRDGRVLAAAPGGQPVDVIDRPRGSTTDVWDRRELVDLAKLGDAPTLQEMLADGWAEYPRRVVERFGAENFVYGSMGAPYWGAYGQLGFGGLMDTMRSDPEALDAIIANRLAHMRPRIDAFAEAGIECIFVEECLSSSDLISEADYLRFSFPSTRELLQHARNLGLRSVYYYCGAIEDRLEHIASLPADALAFEESKKDFVIDLAAVREAVGADRPLLGNIDAALVRDADEARLRREVAAQLAAAGPLLATSAGSPLTLDTDARKLDWIVKRARGMR